MVVFASHSVPQPLRQSITSTLSLEILEMTYLFSHSTLLLWICLVVLLVGKPLIAADQSSHPVIEPKVQLTHAEAGDQDDLCVWRDAADPSRSLVITSDKKANLIAVYDLQGKLLQTLPVSKPGNIDLRHGVKVGQESRDLVVVNQRTDGWKLAVFAVHAAERRLQRLDQNDLETGPNYGLCLYNSPASGLLHAVITSEAGTMEQYAFNFSAKSPAIQRVRHWKLGKTEGAMADDALGRLYLSEEEGGVWELGAEPDQPTPGKLVIRLGEHGLQPDLEGIALLTTSKVDGYLLLSSQGQSRFFVYERTGQHRFVGTFAIAGAEETDGIDVLATPLGPDFPHGIFGCHTAKTKPCRILLTPWDAIARQVTP